MTTRDKMIDTANKTSEYDKTFHGGFINTDGDWCACGTPKEFKKHIESYGFEVVSCKATATSTAIAITKDGFSFARNGFCTLAK